MKILTKEDFEAHDRATLRGAIEGIAGGLAFALPASYIMHKRWASYRALPLSLKALGVIMVVGPAYAVRAEQAGVEFDKSQWRDAGKATLTTEQIIEEQRWESLSTREKFGDWASRNQYKIILASWALSMGVAGAIIMKDKHQTPSQKIVQARMYAQGLTIGVMIAAGIMTHSQRQSAAENRHAAPDHSWAIVLAEQDKLKQAQGQPDGMRAAQAA